jgi:hypothetical protein
MLVAMKVMLEYICLIIHEIKVAKIYKSYMLPPGGINWQLIYPNCVIQQFEVRHHEQVGWVGQGREPLLKVKAQYVCSPHLDRLFCKKERYSFSMGSN